MGDVIELCYRRFSRHVIDRLVRTGYLADSRRHQIDAVETAWDRFRHDVDRLIADRKDPKRPS
jgi:hypothetical protein